MALPFPGLSPQHRRRERLVAELIDLATGEAARGLRPNQPPQPHDGLAAAPGGGPATASCGESGDAYEITTRALRTLPGSGAESAAEAVREEAVRAAAREQAKQEEAAAAQVAGLEMAVAMMRKLLNTHGGPNVALENA